jgi:2-oxoglutarate ferredoxin oxidoreductase subunit alpha
MGREFIDGNEAVARAAARAGCDFFAGYPISPASSILHHMAHAVAETSAIVVQAEDEIASIGMCIGASMAGRKTLTATSGPGMSLYSENIGLAIMGETPLVIVDVQRQGPATGSATKGAEGDIQFARWGTSGGLPVIALSPASVAETYELTYLAFDLAERYRSPVFVLTNKEVGTTRESVDLGAIGLPEPAARRAVPDDARIYLPHAFGAPEEVPPFSGFGDARVARFTTSTHDRGALLTTDPETIGEMIDHYRAKIERSADRLARFRTDREEGAETLVVSYGIVSRSAAVAVREARRRGAKISSIVLQTLWPVPESALRRAMAGMKRVIVPEMNLGQYRREIERLAPPGAEVVGVNKMNTTLLAPGEIRRGGGLP